MRMNTCIIWILMSLLVGLASCKKDPEIPTETTFNSIYVDVDSPSISNLQNEGYVQNGDVIDLNTKISFGFDIASNPLTNKELFSLVVKIDDYEYDNIDLNGKNKFRYTSMVTYSSKRDEIIDESTITATVTDAAGKTATASITLSINRPEQPQLPLEATDFTWFRQGTNPGEGLAEYGLEWTNNAKEAFAVIKPVEGATLYGFSPDIWDEVTTDVEKVAAFTEGYHTFMSDFRGVSVWSTKDYDFVIGTLYNGEYHLIHITRGVVDSSAAGTDITITGQAK